MVRQLRAGAAEFGYAAGWSLLNSVPERVSAPAFRAGADVAATHNGSGVRQLRTNLRRVVGPDPSERQLDQLVGAAMRSYARYWLEAFRLPKMDHAAVVARTRTEGGEHVDAGLAAGRGVIIAVPHQANWDAAALWLVAKGQRFTTVVERLQPESLYRRFVDYRASLGMEVVPLTGGDRPPSQVLAERLRAGGAVCLVADRDLSRGGVEVSFFGEPARMAGGPALLAARTGAVLLPTGMWFTDGGWGQRIHAPVELPDGRLGERVLAGTQLMADVFALEVADHPADWHMLHPLWVADLPGRGERARSGSSRANSGPAEPGSAAAPVEA